MKKRVPTSIEVFALGQWVLTRHYQSRADARRGQSYWKGRSDHNMRLVPTPEGYGFTGPDGTFIKQPLAKAA
jgi:hypothetical protein